MTALNLGQRTAELGSDIKVEAIPGGQKSVRGKGRHHVFNRKIDGLF